LFIDCFASFILYALLEFPKELKSVITEIDNELKQNGMIKEEQPPKEEQSEEDEGQGTDGKINQKADVKSKKHSLFLPQLKSKFSKSQAYGYDKITFGIISSIYDTTEILVFMLIGFLPYIWDVATRVGKEGTLFVTVTGEIGISLIFLAFIQLIGMVTSLPFELVRI